MAALTTAALARIGRKVRVSGLDARRVAAAVAAGCTCAWPVNNGVPATDAPHSSMAPVAASKRAQNKLDGNLRIVRFLVR